METPQESAMRKFPNNVPMQEHYTGILDWLMQKWKLHKTAIKIAKYHTIKKFSKK